MRRSLAGLAVICVAGGSGIGLTSQVAQAVPVNAPVCNATTCTTTFALTSGVQTYTVPSLVTSVHAIVDGGSGGNVLEVGPVVEAGGPGGETSTTLAVSPGDALSVVVGAAGGNTDVSDAGGPGGGGGFGGGADGGAGTTETAAGGGGGSFLFGDDGSLLLAAGGGGGATPSAGGGHGGGAGTAATAGGDGAGGATGGGAGTSAANGSGGSGGTATPSAAGAGDAGSGAVTAPTGLPVAGAGAAGGEPGGGGGGGYHAAGGGGSDGELIAVGAGGAGGGGAGFAAAITGVTGVTGSSGVHSGDGSVAISYTKATQTINFTSTAPTSPVVGQTYDATATGGDSGNDVTFSIDATTSSACSASGATITFLHPGSCVIDANQAGTETDYQAADQVQQTVTTVQDDTTTAVTVHPTTLTATVSAVAPGAGTPTGSITFSVDGTQVGSPVVMIDGAASTNDTVPTDASHTVSAVYSGDADFIDSDGATVRQNPTITAARTSTKPRTAFGWYRRAVTVGFTCTTHGAALTASCPAPVTLSHEGANQTVTKDITATDGGAASITVSGINIDKTAPTVSITGPKMGRVYRGFAPAAHCVRSDALSGIARCRFARHHDGRSQLTTLDATATDQAGNTATAEMIYTVLKLFVRHAARHIDGSFTIHAGHRFQVCAVAAHRPTLFLPTRADGKHPKPFKRGPKMKKTAHNVWVSDPLGNPAQGHHRTLNVGIKIGHKLHVIHVHVV